MTAGSIRRTKRRRPCLGWSNRATLPPLRSADVGLALRYLTDYRVIVAVHVADAIVDQATAAADWAGAHLVLVAAPEAAIGARIPEGALVIEDEVDGTADDGTALAERLGEYAAAIDAGFHPGRRLRRADEHDRLEPERVHRRRGRDRGSMSSGPSRPRR